MTDDKEYGKQTLRLLKKLVESDGIVTDEESTWMEYIKGQLEQSGDEEPFDPATLKAEVDRKGEAEELVSLLLMVSLADGETGEAELKIVHEVAKLVDVSEKRVEDLKVEVLRSLNL